MVKVKNIKKFNNYDMRVADKTIYLICKGKSSLKKIHEYKDKKLITDVYNIGKELNKIINDYSKSEKEKINSEYIQFDKLDIETKNNKIIELIKEYCSRDFNDFLTKKFEDKVIEKLDKPNNNKNSEDTYFFYEIDRYESFYEIFKNSYLFLKKHNINISELNTPNEIYDLIRYDKYGIWENDSTLNFEEPSTNLSFNYMNLIKTLENNKNKLDYSQLLKTVNYIPINIKHLFGEIIQNYPSNKYSKDLFTKVQNFCNEYGVPYWNIKKCDKYDVEIPLNNFILICLSIFIYTELWNKILQYNKIDEWEDFIYSFYVLGINFNYYEEEKNIIKNIISNIEDLDLYISNHCNQLFGQTLHTYRKKVLNKDTNTLGNETIYDSVILASWNIFYLYYFGNNEKFKPIEYKICNICHNEIKGKSHTIRDGSKNILCQNCYKERDKNNTNNRVTKLRNKQKDKH